MATFPAVSKRRARSGSRTSRARTRSLRPSWTPTGGARLAWSRVAGLLQTHPCVTKRGEEVVFRLQTAHQRNDCLEVAPTGIQGAHLDPRAEKSPIQRGEQFGGKLPRVLPCGADGPDLRKAQAEASGSTNGLEEANGFIRVDSAATRLTRGGRQQADTFVVSKRLHVDSEELRYLTGCTHLTKVQPVGATDASANR